METRVGDVIDGKYEVLKQIGKGGMSKVFLSMDQKLNKQWAIKEIRKNAGLNNDIVVKSILEEANLMKKLDHPALPRIVDIIENRDTIYVVMDYIEGNSLDRIIAHQGPLEQEVVIEWAKQLCDVLGYLHRQNPPIIYRDMKPANIMLKPEGYLKLIDFGIAREYKAENETDTTVLGTRGYAPPEQHGSRQTDVRSDIYALGMTMHHLLTGVDPRPADYIYYPIRYWKPELSSNLERIIDKCTALDPKDRYQDCNELMYALEHFEEEEDSYKKKQKGKVKLFFGAVAMSVVFFVIAIVAHLLMISENDKNYEAKINLSSSTPYEKQVDSYLEAIDLYGTDSRAYIKLLGAYNENGVFGDYESEQFTNGYNKNLEKFDKTDEGYWDLCYEAGLTYLYLYSGGDDSFRTRVLKAYPYFSTIVENASDDYENYEMAASYSLLGEFYSKYVVSSTSVQEPAKEDYEELLDSLNFCLSNVQRYEGADSTYVQLIMYREVMNLLNEHRKGLSTTGIDKEEVLSIIDEVYFRTQTLSATQAKTIDVQEDILSNYSTYRENIERSYSNTEERDE